MSQGLRAELRKLQADVGELIAQHERARDLADFSKYADDPAGFMRDVLRCDPWSRQVELAEMVRDNRRVIAQSANSIGKDWLCARLALWWVFARRGFVVLTGPTERQVKQILMREVRRAFTSAPELPGELYSLELRVGEGEDECGILAFTSDNADKLTGYHHPRLLIAITEGQGVGEEAYEAAQACATGPENRLFVYGNPTRPTGSFHRIATSEKWEVLRIPASEHPNVVSGREEIPGAVSREWVELMAAEYGPTSSIYRSRVDACFPEESIEGLIRREWLRAAFKRHASGELAYGPQRVPIMALDVSRFGPDSTVLAIIWGPVVEKLVVWRGIDTVGTAERVIEEGRKVGEQHYLRVGGRKAGLARPIMPAVWVDVPGPGGGVVDTLKRKGYPAYGYQPAGEPTDHSKRFLNMRAQAHWAFRDLLEKGKVAIAPDTMLEEEALACEWTINASGKIQIVAKDLMRKELGRSPDRLDAVVIGLAQTVGRVHRPAMIGSYGLGFGGLVVR